MRAGECRVDRAVNWGHKLSPNAGVVLVRFWGRMVGCGGEIILLTMKGVY